MADLAGLGRSEVKFTIGFYEVYYDFWSHVRSNNPCGVPRGSRVWGSRGGVWGGVMGNWQTLEVGVLEVGRLDVDGWVVDGWVVGGVGGWIKALDAWRCRRI